MVVLDEIEKAHPDVSGLLLQVMENGVLTDATGRRVDFSGTILVLTSNIGTDSGIRGPLGFGSSLHPQVERENSAVKDFFRPEFLNRLDDIIRFRALTATEREEIAEMMLTDLKNRAASAGLILRFEETVPAFIAAMAEAEGTSARPLQRAIATHIENALSSSLLAGRITGKREITVRKKGESLFLEES